MKINIGSLNIAFGQYTFITFRVKKRFDRNPKVFRNDKSQPKEITAIIPSFDFYRLYPANTGESIHHGRINILRRSNRLVGDIYRRCLPPIEQPFSHSIFAE